MECIVYSTIRTRKVSRAFIIRVVEATLSSARHDGNVSVHLIGDRRMRAMNRMYRNRDSTTDVLSFAAQEGEQFTKHTELGDIFISLSQIERQAKQYGMPFATELARMIVHGVLHLVGYDHMIKKQEEIMIPLQEKILEKLL